MTKQDFTEFKVVISDDEQKLTRKFPIYHNGICISHDDPTLREMVNQSKADFKGTPEEIVVHVKYVWDRDGI